MTVLYSKLTCMGSFRSIHLLGPDLSLQYRVMVIASMTEGVRKPWWLWSPRNEWVAGCVGDIHLQGETLQEWTVPGWHSPWKRLEAFWGWVLLYNVRHGRHARVEKGTQRGHFPRATASQARADVGARLFLIFGTSEQEAPVTGALFTEHLKINNLERILPKRL